MTADRTAHLPADVPSSQIGPGVRGFWRALPREGRFLLSTVALQHLGRGMTLPFTVIYLHEVRDFSLERNIVVKKSENGKIAIRLIDFERSGLDECNFKGEIEECMPDPDSRMSFGCGELYDACVRAQLLEPRTSIIPSNCVPY